MKLIYRILTRLSIFLSLILFLWGTFFYLTIMEEVNDEVDDSLEFLSDQIITHALSGENTNAVPDGTNNTYHILPVSPEYAEKHRQIRYFDEIIYIKEKRDTEPARTMKTIFIDHTGQYFELTVSTPTIEKKDLQESILGWVIFLYITLLISILIINVWVFKRSMRPLYILLKWFDRYTLGKQTDTLENPTKISEFRKLNEAITRSVKRNREIFEQQKQFIGNASHELQTPLAICQNRLEILSDSDNLTEEQMTEIQKIQQTLTYIIKLNKSLLFLSKIENQQFKDEKEVNLNEKIKKQLEDYIEIYAHKEIRVEVEEKAQCYLHMSDTLATALVGNLIKNAYIHNDEQGYIGIEIKHNSITFRNTGSDKPLDYQKIFERFYQEKNSHPGSSGLGLSIVLAICKAYGLHVRYDYEGCHTFEIKK